MDNNAPSHHASQNFPKVLGNGGERWNPGTIRVPERVTEPTRIVTGGIRSGLEDTDGWLLEPPPEDAVEHCRTFIESFGRRTPRFCRTATSYGYKHLVEAWLRDTTGTRVYIPQGAFILAALRLGYRVEQAREDSPNAVFDMRLRKRPSAL